MKIDLNEIIDPMEARIVVETGPHGEKSARFDLSGLPRVDQLLIGKNATEAVSMTEHLCGICPVAHHLAGNRALDQLAHVMLDPQSPADLQRRLLHYGSVVEAHSLRFLPLHREAGVTLKKLSRLMLNAAGSPGHFPVTARPGGVATPCSPADLDTLKAALPEGIAAAQAVLDTVFSPVEAARPASSPGHVFGAPRGEAAAVSSGPGPVSSPAPTSGAGSEWESANFAGVDVALIDEAGHPDVFGTRVRAARGTEVLFECDFSQWNQEFVEALPGQAAPRPYLRRFGPKAGLYRVGPLSQLRIGTLTTPLAAAAQTRWLETGGGALAARAVIALHVLERSLDVCARLQDVTPARPATPATPASPQTPEIPTSPQIQLHEGAATGLVDGPRGILAHSYRVDAAGVITDSVILTPTAQNEPWLAQLLTRATTANPGDGLDPGSVPAGTNAALERSIREADPCLPISSAPAGQMHLKLDILKGKSAK